MWMHPEELAPGRCGRDEGGGTPFAAMSSTAPLRGELAAPARGYPSPQPVQTRSIEPVQEQQQHESALHDRVDATPPLPIFGLGGGPAWGVLGGGGGEWMPMGLGVHPAPAMPPAGGGAGDGRAQNHGGPRHVGGRETGVAHHDDSPYDAGSQATIQSMLAGVGFEAEPSALAQLRSSAHGLGPRDGRPQEQPRGPQQSSYGLPEWMQEDG